MHSNYSTTPLELTAPVDNGLPDDLLLLPAAFAAPADPLEVAADDEREVVEASVEEDARLEADGVTVTVDVTAQRAQGRTPNVEYVQKETA